MTNRLISAYRDFTNSSDERTMPAAKRRSLRNFGRNNARPTPRPPGNQFHTPSQSICYSVFHMPTCFKCGTELQVNEEGAAPVLCDRCSGRATSRAQRGMSIGSMTGYPVTITLMAINIAVYLGDLLTGGSLTNWGGNRGLLTLSGEYWR